MQTSLKGLLLIGDLGLVPDGLDNGVAGLSSSAASADGDGALPSALGSSGLLGGAPAVGFLDLAHLLAARQRQHGTPFVLAAAAGARKGRGAAGGRA